MKKGFVVVGLCLFFCANAIAIPAFPSAEGYGAAATGGSGDISLVKLTNPWPAMAINQQTSQVAYNYVLSSAGCSLVRDSVDTRIITEVTNGTATYDGNGYTNLEKYINSLCPNPYYTCTSPIVSDLYGDCQIDSWIVNTSNSWCV